MSLDAHHCFFGVGLAYAQIAGLRNQLSDDRRVPSWLAPTKLESAGYRDLLDLAGHGSECWLGIDSSAASTGRRA